MTPVAVFALVLAGTIAWIAIPFIPAMMELVRPRDASPLNAVGQDSGMLTYFATSFTTRMTAEGLLGTSVPPRLSDGSLVRVHNAMTPLAPARTPITDVVVLMDDTPIPAGTSVATECLARRTFHGGANSSFRAILGQRDVKLGQGTTVLRWVHANGRLEAATGTYLMGRATSDREILLETGVQFDRLDAPMVRVGGGGTLETPIMPVSAYSPFTPDNAISLGAGYWRVRGDLTIPADTSLAGSLIVIGNVVVSEGARVEGSIKAHGSMHIKTGAVVVGAVSARGRIVIEDGARLSGPVISETSVVVGAAVVGVASKRTTVTAPRVELRTGATVYGAVMAGDGGASVK
ncbi:MAG: polymer-forming cytoskeletal protein [Gemmatimonadaceae bacterium]|nr:polymer-forming cytoskeletal protein [Gemmatimonadaceae bacterium]